MSFNPNAGAGGSNGFEWGVVADAATNLDAANALLGWSQLSTVTEDIDSVRPYGLVMSGSPVIAADLYDEAFAAQPEIAGTGHNAAQPWALTNATLAAGSWSAVGAPTLHEAIDDGLVFNPADYITTTVALGGGASTACEFSLASKFSTNGASQWAGKRIAAVGVFGYGASLSNGFLFSGSATLRIGIRIGAGYYNGAQIALNPAAGEPNLIPEYVWTTNPATGRPWTIADLEAFAAGTSRVFVQYLPAGYYGGIGRVHGVYTRVQWVPDTRLGQGSAVAAGTQYQPIDLSSPEYFNLLTANQADFEVSTDPTGWTVFGGITALLAGAHGAGTFDGTGSRSLKVTCSGGTATLGPAISSEAPVVTPGRTVAARARLRAGTTGRTVALALAWYDANDALISTTAGTGVADNNTGFTTVTVSGVAPANTRRVHLFATIAAAAAAEVHYLDKVELSYDAVAPAFVAGGAQRTFASKLSGRRYLVALHRVGTSGVYRVPAPTSFALCPHGCWSYRPTAKSIGAASDAGAIDSLGAVRFEVPALMLVRTDAAMSVDSQPYSVGGGIDVFNTHTVYQTITPTGSGTQAFIRVIAQYLGSNPATVPDLIVKIKRHSDGSQLGSGQLNITAASLTAPRSTLQAKAGTISPGFPVVSGTKYRVEFSSAAAQGAWRVTGAATGAGAAASLINGTTFGGNTDLTNAPLIGGDRADIDTFALLAVQPVALTGLAGSLVGSPITRARLTWTPIVGSVNFVRYEIERDDQDGLGYQRIGVVTNQATGVYESAEAPINNASLYRVRWLRADGAASLFPSPVSITRTPWCCKYEIVRDTVSPALWVQADSLTQPRVYEFDETLVVNNLYDSDERYARRATEDHGDRFDLELLLYGADNQRVPVQLAGRAAFNAIRALVRASDDYLVVNDSDGNRWYAQVEIPQGVHEEPGGLYTVPVTVHQLRSTPVVV